MTDAPRPTGDPKADPVRGERRSGADPASRRRRRRALAGLLAAAVTAVGVGVVLLPPSERPGPPGATGPPGTSEEGTPAPPRFDAIRAPTPEQRERLSVDLAVNVDRRFASDFARYERRIVDTCRAMRSEPRLDDQALVDRTVDVFRGVDLPAFDADDAALLLQAMRAGYCPITG